MLKFLGFLFLVICGIAVGESAGEFYREKHRLLVRTVDMFSQIEIMLEFESPTICQMITSLQSGNMAIPLFIKSCENSKNSDEVLNLLRNNPDCYETQDFNKLTEFFSSFGTADRNCELQRVAAAKACFNSRLEESRTETEQKAKLAKSLSILGGIFLAVIII